jgi:asparagine synthase (glutamine-hydrolysing)
MCGICGQVHFLTSSQPSVNAVPAMLDRLVHRGPDGHWIKADHAASFGMARLTIRGLTSGEQPLTDAASGVMVICNGEIDNHLALREWLAERGRPVEQDTDVAVLPGLYLELGEAFVEKLIGAFAIAVWDPRQSKLLLIRDRAGERPLFYSLENGVATFASQLAAMAVSHPEPQAINNPAVRRYLQLGYFPAPDSPLEGVIKVGPAECVTLSAEGIQTTRYWRWPRAHPPKIDRSQAAFDTVFRNAVWRQSEVDVPVGLFLSGGVDSSLIAAVARSLHPEKSLTAYGLRFREDSFDEGQFAEQVASDLGIEYIPVWVTPNDIPRLLKDVIRTSGEPLADPAWIPTALLSERAAQDIRISLSGEGADELFGGYPTYFGAGFAERYALLPPGLRRFIRDQVERWPPSDKKVTLSFLLKRFVQGDTLDGVARHVLWNSSIAPGILARLGLSPELPPWSAPGGESLLDQIQHYDLERSLAEGLLTKADRASMHSALELRAPFLDQAVMEFAAALTPDQRVKGIQTKVFLKQYASRYLPKDIVYRKKRGLSVPLSSWLREPLRDWVEHALGRPVLDRIGLDRHAALELMNEHLQRQADHGRAIWALVVMSEWLAWLGQSDSEPSPLKTPLH